MCLKFWENHSWVLFLNIPNDSEILASLLDNKKSLEFISTFMDNARPWFIVVLDDFRGQKHNHIHLWHSWTVSNGWLRMSCWEAMGKIMELSVAVIWVTSLCWSLFNMPTLGDLQIHSVWSIHHLTSFWAMKGYNLVPSPSPWTSRIITTLSSSKQVGFYTMPLDTSLLL